MNSPCRIVIVGRPNVGKSTLFNRLINKKKALVHDLPGVTRDRIVEQADWSTRQRNFPVTLIDTGGLGGDHFAAEIEKQVQLALSEADVVLFLLDNQNGLLPLDEELWTKLQRQGVLKHKPVIGVVNKVDHPKHEDLSAEFYSLGLDQILTVSAEHGRGIDDLKDAIYQLSPGFSETEKEEPAKKEKSESPRDVAAASEEGAEEDAAPSRTPRIAVVGRPNVGKSTLVNVLLGEQRVITSPIAGTTVDPIDSVVNLGGKPFVLVDTAGIRRKGKTQQGVEVLSVVQTKKVLEKSDLAILVLDGEHGISDQDEKIGGLIEEVGCSIIIAMNKWDTQKGNPKFTKEVAAELIRKKMPFLKYAPLMFISAMKGQGLDDLGDLIEEILHQRKVKVTTKEFTEWVRQESTIHNPRNAKFYLCHQAGRNPPTFVCHVNDPDKIHFSLSRHLVNVLRERWGFMGTPIRLHFVGREKNEK